MAVYELLYKKSGDNYAVDKLGDAPRAITAADFEAGAMKVMQAKLDALKAEKDTLKVARDEHKERTDKAEAALDLAFDAIKAGDQDRAQSLIKLARKAKRDARRDELLAKIAADQAELAAIVEP